MKKKSSKLRLPYFFGQRIHSKASSGYMPALIKPEAEWDRTETGTEDILRWADDGGKMLDLSEYQTTGPNSNSFGNRKTNDECQQNRNVLADNDSISPAS